MNSIISQTQTISDAIIFCGIIVFVCILCITCSLISISSSIKRIAKQLETKQLVKETNNENNTSTE